MYGPYLQRKYVDLIRQVSSKWVNWDPPIEIQVCFISISTHLWLFE